MSPLPYYCVFMINLLLAAITTPKFYILNLHPNIWLGLIFLIIGIVIDIGNRRIK